VVVERELVAELRGVRVRTDEHEQSRRRQLALFAVCMSATTIASSSPTPRSSRTSVWSVTSIDGVRSIRSTR
jgi:hypothetical protein